MSFRMRGRAYGAASYAATWVLIVSAASSIPALGAPTRREARRVKRNPCCPAEPKCAPCNTCNACQTCDGAPPVTLQPAIAPPAEAPPPDPKPENSAAAPNEKVAPVADTPPAVEAASPSNESTSLAPASLRSDQPVIVTSEAPPEPSTAENSSNSSFEPASNFLQTIPPVGATLQGDSTSHEANLAIEPPRPAEGGSRYQEYLNRYFDRKNQSSSTESEAPSQQETSPAPVSPSESDPALEPPKTGKDYNDPFRPTSYRSSPERSWRDTSGASRMKARFLGVDEQGFAKMIREDGRRTRVPLANLSAADQRYIELLAIHDTITPTQSIASRPKGR
jgi:hypothetical protein